MTSTDFFEHISRHYSAQLPFVIYRKPNKNEVLGLLQTSDVLHHTEDFTEKGFVFAPFNNSEKTVLIPQNSSKTINYTSVIFNTERTARLQETKCSEVEKENHKDLIKKGIYAIKNKAFKKVVLSRKERISITDNDPINIFKKLLHTYASAFVYCWYHPKVGLWLGATPETLAKIEGNQFSIMALAGTQSYKGSLNVNWQDKERQEQKYVTDFILNNIQSAIGDINVSDVTTIKAGNLLHLKTKIWGTIKDNGISLKDLLYSLHPTPAVCGLPKAITKEFILEHENYNREFYTGFLGEINLDKRISPRSGNRNIENRAYSITKQSTQLYVNLRCMQLQDNIANIYVGGGITESSNVDLEWEEILAKSMVIKSIL